MPVHPRKKINGRIFFLILLIGTGGSQSSIAQQGLTPAAVDSASELIGLRFSAAEKDSMMDDLRRYLGDYRRFHRQSLDNSAPMTLNFDPALPGMRFPRVQQPLNWDIPGNVLLPPDKNELAFYSILQLASLIRHKKISSVELTRFFLQRLERYGDTLHCVVSLTPGIAMQEARQADADLARGIYRGPLQGIPYGLKDLFDVKGTRTTWGASPYKDRSPDENAFVYEQLKRAGAVLVAKLSMGELAMGDVWFGGLTRNPWDLNKGSSGSSAGPASAVTAGLVPFAIGTETWGSIVSPSATCGATGLRPTFGSVSRSGAMALAWSSDKIGPICHSAEDAAIVFSAIHGTDGKDLAARNMPFNFNSRADIRRLKVAYARNYIDTLPESDPVKKVLQVLRRKGVKLVPIDFPGVREAGTVLGIIIGAESAAAFDELTLSHRDSLLAQQGKDAWPNQFRASRFIPATAYIKACRLRYQIMQEADPLIEQFDAIIIPTFAGSQLALTNLTGHPVVVMPNGFDLKTGLPSSITFIGRLYGEGSLLELAKGWQDATEFHKKHPALFR